MTTHPTEDEFRDDRVSATYREIANEQTPESLDRAVLDAARRQARGAKTDRWRRIGYRPVALAATIGLSLALVLELSRMTSLEPPAPENVSTLPADVFEAAGDRTAAEIERLGTEMTPSVPAATVDPAPVDAGTDSSLLPVDDHCSEEDRSTASRWWSCIEDLEQRGLTASAERELQALLKAFPAFSVPE